MDSQTKTSMHASADAILEQMPLGVAVYDAQELRLLRANTLFLTMMNLFLDPAWQQGQIIGSPVTDWAHPAAVPGLVGIFRAVAESGTPYRVGEFAFPTPQGNPTYWNWTVDRMLDQDGHSICLLQTISEVTAHVLARQQAEQAYASLSQTNRTVEAERKRLEIIEIVARTVRESLDTQSIGRATSEAIRARFTPLSVAIHIADPVQQALRLISLPTAPSAQQAVRFLQHVPYDSSLLLAQAHKRRDPIILEDVQAAAALGMIAPDHPVGIPRGVRGYICIPLWFKDHFEGTLTTLFSQSVHREGPEVQALVGCVTHIATALAHARVHATIEHERARLRTVLDQLPEGIVIVEASDGCISYVNAAAARILGTSVTRLLGLPLSQHPHTRLVTYLDGRPIPNEEFSPTRVLQGETISNQEVIVTRLDGSKVVLLGATAPLRMESGVITGSVSVFQDITARKSLEQQKNAFLSIASHELRTPVTTILGLSEILQMQVAQGQSLDSPRSLRAIASITEQSQRLSQLIGELLDISRIENAQLLLAPAPHDLIRTLRHVVETQTITTKQHKLQVVLEGLETTDTLLCCFDEGRIEQVLNNLISNAIKYSSTGSEIVVGLQYSPEKPDEALIWVKDHGIGIPADELPHIFERFHRAGNQDRSISGLGIGLYLVNELVTRHGGRVWAESSEGVGSTFYVQLPLKQSQEEGT